MKLPVQLPAHTCWLMLPFDDPASATLQPDAHGWRESDALPSTLETIAPEFLSHMPAAVRLLGESTDRTLRFAWCAAIDPVTLAADMRDVRIQVWPQRSLLTEDASQLLSAISALLSDDKDARLNRMRIISVTPWHWYLVSDSAGALDFQATPAGRLLGEPLRHHKLQGEDGRLMRRLITEIQMTMHAHDVNVARVARGQPAVNGVWVWGSGALPAVTPLALPALVTDDPYWRGCWRLLAPNSDVYAIDSLTDVADRCAGRVVATGSRGHAADVARSVFSAPAVASVIVSGPDFTRVYRRRGRPNRWLRALGGRQR